MTSVLFAATVWHYVFGILIFLTSVFLILLVLVQRGRGGGLTGALGGMGGQSAFGTKAGDVFTRITMVTAAIWILLCMGAIWKLGSHNPWEDTSDGGASISTGDKSGDADEGAGDSSGDGEGGGMGATDSGGADTSTSSGTTAPEDSSGGNDD